jgi:uncharacterized phiE125 gp8 family phage protein
MATFLTRPPAVEPVTLAEAKAHLRIDGAEEDGLLGRLIAAARGHVEGRTRRVLIEQGWRMSLDAWPPRGGAVRLAPAPLISVEAVTVYDADGLPRVLDAADYTVDAASVPGRLKVGAAGARPARAINGIEIDLTAGYGTDGAAVPADLRQAVLMLVAHWFEHREAARIGAVAAPVAMGVEMLLAPFRVARL